MTALHFVTFDHPGVRARGKGPPGYIRHVCANLRALGVSASEQLSLTDLLARDINPEDAGYALLHYNESTLAKAGAKVWLEEREEELIDKGYKILHPAQIGHIIGTKSLLNARLASAGVAVPRRVQNNDRFNKVFSNADSGSHEPVQTLESGATLDEDRYNTDYIDTVHEVDGKHYYVSLRSQAVGRQAIYTWVRARPVEEGDPSVHTTDTPGDMKLQRALHDRLVTPNEAKLREISERIYDAVGFGLLCHDILPERDTGKLYVCETGYKFHDTLYRLHLRKWRRQHPVPDVLHLGSVAQKVARTMVEELKLVD